MGLIDIVSGLMKSQGGDPAQQPLTPEMVGQMPSHLNLAVPNQAVAGVGDSAGYAMPHQGYAMGTAPMHQANAAPMQPGMPFGQAGKNLAQGSADADKIMQQGVPGQGQGGFVSQPQLYHALAQVYGK